MNKSHYSNGRNEWTAKCSPLASLLEWRKKRRENLFAFSSTFVVYAPSFDEKELNVKKKSDRRHFADCADAKWILSRFSPSLYIYTGTGILSRPSCCTGRIAKISPVSSVALLRTERSCRVIFFSSTSDKIKKKKLSKNIWDFCLV